MSNRVRSDFLIEFFGSLANENIFVSSLPNHDFRGVFKPRQIATRNPEEIERFLAEHDVVGRGQFFCVAPILESAGAVRNKSTVSSLVCLHADIDFKGVVGNRTSISLALKKLARQPTYTIFSGHGIHIYYLFSVPLEANEDNKAQVEIALKKLAHVVAGDPSVCELSRVMRVPGTRNTKDRNDIVECIVEDASNKRYTFGDLLAWLGVQGPVLDRIAEENAPTPTVGPINFFVEYGKQNARGESLDLDAMWETLVYPGNVHNTEVQMIASLLSRGESVDNAIDFVIQGLQDHIPQARSWDMMRERRELRTMAVGWFDKHPDLMELQIDPPAWLLSNGKIKKRVLPHYSPVFSDSSGTPSNAPEKPAPASEKARVVDWKPSITNGTARKMDEPQDAPKDEEAKPEEGATIHEFPRKDRVHLKSQMPERPVPQLNVRWGEDIETDPVVSPEWIVPNFIMKGALNGYFGDGGVGKDLTLQQLCIAMATGKDWLGMPVRPGRALYVNVEDNWQMIRYRQDAIQRYYGIEFKDFPERYVAASMVGQSTVLATFDSRLGIVKPTPLYESFDKLLGELRPDLVVVGNRVNIFGVNQNEDSQARQCLELLNALILKHGCTIIMPGHVSVQGMTNSTGTSGSVQWSNGTRNRVFISKVVPDNAEEATDTELRTRILTVMKANWSAAGVSTKIAWHTGFGLFVPVAQADGFEVTENLTPQQRQKRAEDEFLNMLSVLNADRAYVSANSRSPTNYAPKVMVKDKRCKFYRQPFVELEEAMHRLKANRTIILEQYGPPSANTFRLIEASKIVR